MAKVVVSRLEKHPVEEPNSFAVGFTVTCANGRTFYVDATVPFTEAKTDEEAVTIAYQRLKEYIDTQVTALEKRSPLLGQDITDIKSNITLKGELKENGRDKSSGTKSEDV